MRDAAKITQHGRRAIRCLDRRRLMNTGGFMNKHLLAVSMLAVASTASRPHPCSSHGTRTARSAVHDCWRLHPDLGHRQQQCNRPCQRWNSATSMARTPISGNNVIGRAARPTFRWAPSTTTVDGNWIGTRPTSAGATWRWAPTRAGLLRSDGCLFGCSARATSASPGWRQSLTTSGLRTRFYKTRHGGQRPGFVHGRLQA